MTNYYSCQNCGTGIITDKPAALCGRCAGMFPSLTDPVYPLAIKYRERRIQADAQYQGILDRRQSGRSPECQRALEIEESFSSPIDWAQLEVQS